MFLPGIMVGGFVTGIVDDIQVQPAGVDLRVSEVRSFNTHGSIGFHEKSVPSGVIVEPKDGWWFLNMGAYRVRFSEVVEVPEWAVGFCYPRSSLLRMGVFLGCAVWDPGYRGRGEALLVVFNRYGVRIEVGARIAQLVYAKLSGKPDRVYRGTYINEGL